MSTLAIHYFTGTGNTARALKRITGDAVHAGREVSVLEVKAGVQPPAASFDTHLFAYPTLALSAPVLMKRYLRRLPDGRGARAAVLALTGATFSRGRVDGGNPGQGLVQAERILRRRGYDVFLTRSVSFPSNLLQVSSGPHEAGVKAIFSRGEPLVGDFAADFLAGKKDLRRLGLARFIWMRAVSVLYGLVGRRALGKMYLADARCNACGLCARACPGQVIRMKGAWPRWRANCELCDRCINICPKEAIQFSLPLLILHLIVHGGLFILAFQAMLGWLPDLILLPQPVLALGQIFGLVSAVILIFILSFTVIDAFFQTLARLRPIRRFFSLSWTRRFRRYTAPGFNPLKPV
jgi:NAD-dependent dihydropyrimidine dehydrogenase PreA subunit